MTPRRRRSNRPNRPNCPTRPVSRGPRGRARVRRASIAPSSFAARLRRAERGVFTDGAGISDGIQIRIWFLDIVLRGLHLELNNQVMLR